MTKDQTDRIEVIEGILAATHIKIGSPNISDVECELLCAKVAHYENQIEAIEEEGKNYCACGCEVYEKQIHKYHREMSGGEEIEEFICDTCNDFDPMDL